MHLGGPGLIIDGQLLIGTNNAGNYKLAINGALRADEIFCKSEGADFVFKENYQLPSLDEVESYIKANRRLPEIPSAVEMQANGVSLGEMQTKLLQKIEELTLYMIELKKENGTLAHRVTELQERLHR